jgi:hypothetical protein
MLDTVSYVAAYNSVVAMSLRIVVRHVYDVVPMYMDVETDERVRNITRYNFVPSRTRWTVPFGWALGRRGYAWGG